MSINIQGNIYPAVHEAKCVSPFGLHNHTCTMYVKSPVKSAVFMHIPIISTLGNQTALSPSLC